MACASCKSIVSLGLLPPLLHIPHCHRDFDPDTRRLFSSYIFNPASYHLGIYPPEAHYLPSTLRLDIQLRKLKLERTLHQLGAENVMDYVAALLITRRLAP